MNIASQIAYFKERGFPDDHAQSLALMRMATGVLFRDFPDSFLLFGGSSLVFFHQSERHSGDIDLLSRAGQSPTLDNIRESLMNGLKSTAEALGLAPLQFEANGSKLWTRDHTGSALFSVDLTQFGSVIAGEVVEQKVPIDTESATVYSASRDLLFLQKAECFLLRPFVKTRDAYDLHLLKNKGASLDEAFKGHLSDTISSYEIEPADIASRIESGVDEKHCNKELKPILPSSVFAELATNGFESLRSVLRNLYQDWL